MQSDRIDTLPRKILIVDDRPERVCSLTVLLQLMGYEVRHAENEQQAWQAIASAVPDLILLAAMQAAQAAEDLCRALKHNPLTRATPILFLISSLDSRDRVFAAGGDDYLLEPWLAAEVKARLEPYLRGGRTQPAADEDVQVSPHLFNTLANAAPMLLWMVGTDGLCTFVNQQWLDLTGSTLAESLGVGWSNWIHPEDRDRVLQSYQTHFEARQPLEIEYRLRRADGTYCWLLDRSKPHFNSQQDFEGYIGCCIEIDDRKAAVVALQESEARYRLLFNSGNDLIFVHHFNADGKPSQFIEVNNTACKTLGYTRAELLQLSPQEIDITTGKSSLTSLLTTLCEQGHCVFKCVLLTKDGQHLAVENNAHLFVLQGQMTCLTVSRNISDRVTAEANLRASEERFRLIAENMTDLVCLHEPDGTYIYLSPSCEALLGYKPEELIGINPYRLFHEEDRKLIRDLAHQPNKNGRETSITYRLRAKSGAYIWLNTLTKPIVDELGCVQRLLSTSREVGDRIDMEIALRASQRRLNAIINNTSYGIVIVDRQGQVRFVNTAATLLFNRSRQELLGSHLGIPASATAPNEPTELEILSSRDRIITVEMRVAQIEWDEEPVDIISLQDITERKEAEAQLEYRAYYDTLTDLPNRTLFISRLTQAIQRSQRRKEFHFAVLFLDLDRFKVVNDSLGHLVGDRLLVAFAQRLKVILRPLDTVARLGGDEFTILIEDIKDVRDATQVAQRISVALQSPFNLDGLSVFTTASIGIALSNESYTQPEYLLRDADLAMYRAKEQGRSRYEIFDQAMHQFAVQQLQLENDLRRAIERQELVAYYQPIIKLKTQELVGFEALVRWQHPDRGLVPPNDFIPIAEETGLIVAIGEWVLQHTCEQLHRWHSTLPQSQHLSVSVNLSSQQLREANLLETIDRVLAQTQLAGRFLKLELTESMLIEDVEDAIALLQNLRDRGIQLSIDDFGTGYSSLSYLHRFPLNTLKIDKSFVSRIGLGENREIVETIIALARQLNLRAIAEGVETRQQLEQLQHLNCEFAQGYYFAPPLSPEAAEQFIVDFGLPS
jgi:diguanylate cyclase (GGDEF)-like protein/PAS domain S-box-containing protein